jgi:hypothetical protein
MFELAEEYVDTQAFLSISAKSNSRKKEVKNILYRFLQERLSFEEERSSVGYYVLLHNSMTKSIEPTGNPALLSTFEFISSSPYHLDVCDNAGSLLAARFKISMDLIETLTTTTAILTQVTSHFVTRHKKNDHRGFSDQLHYIAWADSARSPFTSSQYNKHLPYSRNWIQANQDLWNRVSHYVRLLAPKMYVKMKKPTSMFPPSVKPLCVAYHGVCLNRGVEDPVGSATHRDVKDDYSIFNAVIPFGDFKEGELVL